VFYIDVAKIDRDVARVAMVFQVYVLNISSVFRCILQVFYLDVVKYILMLHIHAYCKRMFQVFHMYVASVSSGCYICFAMATHMFF
jgi:hypothetical protein